MLTEKLWKSLEICGRPRKRKSERWYTAAVDEGRKRGLARLCPMSSLTEAAPALQKRQSWGSFFRGGVGTKHQGWASPLYRPSSMSRHRRHPFPFPRKLGRAVVGMPCEASGCRRDARDPSTAVGLRFSRSPSFAQDDRRSR
jgi:hypothetical protein